MATSKQPPPPAPSRGHRRVLSDGGAAMSKENAAKISSRIDEELKVCTFCYQELILRRVRLEGGRTKQKSKTKRSQRYVNYCRVDRSLI